MSEGTPRSVIAEVIDDIYGEDGWDVAGNVLDALTDGDVWQLARIREVPRCDTCRHWGASVSGNGYWGFCDRVDEESQLGYPAAWLTDKATLATTADFGCVLWEPHDTEGAA